MKGRRAKQSERGNKSVRSLAIVFRPSTTATLELTTTYGSGKQQRPTRVSCKRCLTVTPPTISLSFLI